MALVLLKKNVSLLLAALVKRDVVSSIQDFSINVAKIKLYMKRNININMILIRFDAML